MTDNLARILGKSKKNWIVRKYFGTGMKVVGERAMD